MTRWFRIAVISLFSGHAWTWSGANGVQLQKALRTRDYTLVAFVETDNSKSRLLDEEWSTIVDADNTLLRVDCTIESRLCEEHDVRSFPAIRLYRSGGTVYDHYRGPRQAGEITAFVNRSLRPVVSGLTTENVTDFSSIDEFVFILHLTDADAGKGLYKRFHDLATQFGDRYSFGVIPNDEEDGVSTLDCYNNLDKVQRSTQRFFEDFNSLSSFFKNCATRLIPEMTHANKRYFTESKRAILYYFDFHSDHREKYSSHLRETAKKSIDDVKFVTVDPMSFPDVAASVGLRWDFPAIALQDKSRGLMFPSKRDQDITPEFVEDFLRSVADGSVTPAFQYHNAPATMDGNKAITGENEKTEHDEL